MTPEEIQAIQDWMRTASTRVGCALTNWDKDSPGVRGFTFLMWLVYMFCSMIGTAHYFIEDEHVYWFIMALSGIAFYPAMIVLWFLTAGLNRTVLAIRKKHSVSQGKRIKQLEEENERLEKELGLV